MLWIKIYHSTNSDSVCISYAIEVQIYVNRTSNCRSWSQKT